MLFKGNVTPESKDIFSSQQGLQAPGVVMCSSLSPSYLKCYQNRFGKFKKQLTLLKNLHSHMKKTETKIAKYILPNCCTQGLNVTCRGTTSSTDIRIPIRNKSSRLELLLEPASTSFSGLDVHPYWRQHKLQLGLFDQALDVVTHTMSAEQMNVTVSSEVS